MKPMIINYKKRKGESNTITKIIKKYKKPANYKYLILTEFVIHFKDGRKEIHN